jgi:ribonuclease P protein component
MNYKFPKSEKLRLKRDIEHLYAKGQNTYKYPISIRYVLLDGEGTNLCAVSVPKRKFKKAVDRNRIKRQLREAYRLNKHILMDSTTHFHMMIVYSSAEKETYQKIEKTIIKLLNKIKS